MLIEKWADKPNSKTFGGQELQLKVNILNNIRIEAWKFFRTEIENNFILRLLGVVGKIRKIFTKMFGDEPFKLGE